MSCVLYRPTQDYLPVGATKTCKIVFSRLRDWPDTSDPKNLKDKFLVQATQIEKEVEDITKFVNNTQHTQEIGENSMLTTCVIKQTID